MVEVGGGGGQEQAIKLQYWPRRVAFMVVYAERLYAPGVSEISYRFTATPENVVCSAQVLPSSTDRKEGHTVAPFPFP